MASVDLVQRLATLQAGRNIVLRNQVQVTPSTLGLPPQNTNEGISISDGGGVLLAWVFMRMRLNVAAQRSIVQITNLVVGETYSVNLDYGDELITYSDVPGLVEPEEFVLQEIADLINAQLPKQKWAAVVAGSGADATLTVDGIPSVSILPFICATNATGAGLMTNTSEAAQVSFRVWGLPKGATYWVRLPVEGRPDAVSDKIRALQNYGERYIVSGMVRIFVEVVTTDGTVTPVVAPALEE